MRSFIGMLGAIFSGPESEMTQTPRDSTLAATTLTGSGTERVPFCYAFRACLYGRPTDVRPVPAPHVVAFMPLYREQCWKEGLDPETFLWNNTDLTPALFAAAIESGSEDVNVLLSRSRTSTDAVLV